MDRGELLIVCTGNICRSPYIERRLTQLLDIEGAVSSAGVHAVVDAPMSAGSVVELTRRGGEAHGFQARQLTESMIDEASLVLCATREHRREVVQLNPRGLTKTFALADFADLVQFIPAGTLAPDPMADPNDAPWTTLARAAARERGEINPRSDERATIVDPIGQSDAVYAQMAQQIEEILPPVVAALSR